MEAVFSPDLYLVSLPPRILKGSQDLSDLHSLPLCGTLPRHLGNPCLVQGCII
ncbi:hypothetical protein ACRRTK_006886 [Alexandromys fortis]